MIVDLARHVAGRRPQWERLDALLRRLEDDPAAGLDLATARELELAYRRASADLARLSALAAEGPERASLESLVARAHLVIHRRRPRGRPRPLRWLLRTVPRTIRAHAFEMRLVLAAFGIGAMLGMLALMLVPETKADLLGDFGHLHGDPSERVAAERADPEPGAEMPATFAGSLMTHNIRVTLLALTLGLTAGFGTFVVLVVNGVILGLVVLDYVLAGEAVFLASWLLPHGSVEIPAILLGAQAGFVIGRAMLDRARAPTLARRLALAAPAVTTLAGFAALLLVWAGIVEAYLSPDFSGRVPDAAKIAFGTVQLIVLVLLVTLGGRSAPDPEESR